MIASRLAAEVRLAEPSDTCQIAAFMLQAGAGLYEYLLNDLVRGLGAADILALAISEDDNAYFHGNALVAWIGDEAAGLALAFPSEELALPEAARDIIPAARLKAVAGLFQGVETGAFYLNSLAVNPAAGRRGIGRLLLETTAGVAAMRGFSRMSLHVWTDNTPAMGLYGSLGFQVERLIEMAPSPHFTHRGPVAVVCADIGTMLERLGAPG